MDSKLHMSPRTNPGRPADVGATSSCSGSQSMLNAEYEYEYYNMHASGIDSMKWLGLSFERSL